MGKVARLFTIKTRFEAWLVTYAIALGAVERGIHYLAAYPGFGGWLLALACTGVVFIAGAKLLDSVTPGRLEDVAPARDSRVSRRRAPRRISRSRPRWSRPTGSASPISLRKD